MNTQATQTEDHGKEQAKAQAASIIAMVAALECNYDRLEELREEHEAFEGDWALSCPDDNEELKELEQEAGDCTNQEDAQQRIQEDPLSVEVRSKWTSLGEDLSASEFRIVLCAGGPHVEIVGDLDDYGTPCRAWMQYQDWGTPLTRYFDVESSTLLAYCHQFYFGE